VVVSKINATRRARRLHRGLGLLCLLWRVVAVVAATPGSTMHVGLIALGLAENLTNAIAFRQRLSCGG
jgi:hypothetical protein